MSKITRLADMCRYALRVIETSPPNEAELVAGHVEKAWDLLTTAAQQLEELEEKSSGPVRIAGKRVPPPTVEFRAAA